MTDYDVRVTVTFTVAVGVPQDTREAAAEAATAITRSVFRQSYNRAEDVDIEIVSVEERAGESGATR